MYVVYTSASKTVADDAYIKKLYQDSEDSVDEDSSDLLLSESPPLSPIIIN